MTTEYGMYTFTTSKNAEVDYPALVDAMNHFSWGRGFGCWRLQHNHLAWGDETWSYAPIGFPAVVTQWYQRINGEIVTVRGDGLRCGYVDASSEVYFDPDECVEADDQEILREIGTHVKNGWIEIACFTLESVKYMSFRKLRIYANGRVVRLMSDSGPESMKRDFAFIDDSSRQSTESSRTTSVYGLKEHLAQFS